MIKGAQKQMIVVKTDGNRFFEEAYFVLRREATATAGGDMVSEANKIIRQSASPQAVQKGKARLPWQIALGFLCGLVTGGGIATVICLLL